MGGPAADTGLTGRKLMVDTYGCSVPHGGGAFSGKDPTKMDRSGAYMMRYLAKNIVAAGVCNRCTLKISYVIGKANPHFLNIDPHDSECVPRETILQFINSYWILRRAVYPIFRIRDLKNSCACSHSGGCCIRFFGFFYKKNGG